MVRPGPSGRCARGIWSAADRLCGETASARDDHHRSADDTEGSAARADSMRSSARTSSNASKAVSQASIRAVDGGMSQEKMSGVSASALKRSIWAPRSTPVRNAKRVATIRSRRARTAKPTPTLNPSFSDWPDSFRHLPVELEVDVFSGFPAFFRDLQRRFK